MELHDVFIWTSWALAGLFIAAVSQGLSCSRTGK